MKRFVKNAGFVLLMTLVGIIFFGNNIAKAEASASVSKDVLSVKCQITADTTENSETSNLRLVSTIDSLEYKKIGFEITFKDTTIDYNTTTVFERIEANPDGVEYGFSPNVFDIDSKYFVTATLVGISNSNFNEGFLIKPYCVTMAGEKIYGTNRYVSVSDGYSNTVNVPYESTAEAGTSLNVSVGDVDYPANVIYNDGTYAHMRISVNENLLKSVTEFNVPDNDGSKTVRYRKMYEDYDGTADTSWYDASKEKQVIITATDLYGFASLINSASYSDAIKNQTFYIGADIVVNADVENPTYKDWVPIGTNATGKVFTGVLDGQNHKISGIYCSRSSQFTGLFGMTDSSSTVQNIRIEDSYFESTNSIIGSIAGRGNGNFINIYSKSTVNCAEGLCGGLIGQINASGKKISNCWFSGSVNVSGANKFGIGGIVGSANSSNSLTIEHCLNTGAVNNPNASAKGVVRTGGIIGGIEATTVNIDDTLNVGVVNTGSSTNQVGSVIGWVAGSPTVNITATYATTECYAGSKDGTFDTGSTIKGTISRVGAEALMGEAAYESTEIHLKFDEYWVVKSESTPELKMFAGAQAIHLADISWYDDNTDTYILYDAADLYGFSKLANAGKSFSGKTIKLGADITVNIGNHKKWESEKPLYADWIPIGRSTFFAGTFDGQGYKISGICAEDQQAYMGLFGGTTESAVIKNFRLENSLFVSSGDHVGSVAGRVSGSFANIYSNAIVISGNCNSGGIVGQVSRPGQYTSIVNCWFDGTCTLNGANSYHAGGIVGAISAASGAEIKHCLSTGTITNNAATSGVGRIGGIVGAINPNIPVEMEDCLTSGDVVDSKNRTVGSVVGLVSTANMLSVTHVYVLESDYNTVANGTTKGKIDVVAKTNILGADGYHNTLLMFDDFTTEESFDGYWIAVENDIPQLRSFSKKDAVTLSGTVRKDVSWYDAADTTKGTESNPYVLSTTEELYGLSELSNSGTTFGGIYIELGANIIVNAGETTLYQDWYPIGRSSEFAGHFNGKGHTISGIYSKYDKDFMGLFARTNSASSIENIRLLNSYFSTTGSYAGSISGNGNGTFKNIYSDATVEAAGCNVGGVIGRLSEVGGSSSVEECWFAGDVTLNGTGECYHGGGMVGAITAAEKVEIKNCLNTGTVTNNATTSGVGRIGGIVGGINNITVLIEDCLNVGNIIDNKSRTRGAIVGWMANASSVTFTDNYASTESCNSVAVGNNSIESGIDMHSKESYYGQNAMSVASGLDYNTTWITVEGYIPVLDRFYDMVTVDYLAEIWKGNVVYEESVMVLANEDGTIEPIQLLYPATEILGVKSSDLKTGYVEGDDYELDEDGNLVVDSTGNIPVTKYNEYYLSASIPGNSFISNDASKWLYFSEDGFFHKRQIVVTYRHTTEWTGSIPKQQGVKLTNTIAKLENKEELNVLFYGDSITTGANASGRLGLAPYLDIFPNLVVNELKETYDYENITITNTALGGKTSAWGAEQASSRVAAYSPDLLVVGFGMNDRDTTVADYKANIKTIIDSARDANAECDIILIATMLPNEELPGFYGNQELFLAALIELATEYENIAVADMTTMHKDLLVRKAFRDMTGNNVNHTNDFLTRIYAQVIIESLRGMN